MSIRNTASIAVFALAAAALPIVTPPPAAHAGTSIGTGRAAEPFAPKWFRKLVDYIGCAGSIVVIKDSGTAAASVVTCSNALKTWFNE